MSQTETSILAGGCFWGMQDLIRKLPGVISTRVGYSGGDVPNATYRNHGSHAVAEDTIADVNASGLWPGKVVTEICPAGPFWLAEPEHQDYLEHNPGGHTCHFPRRQWKLPQRAG